MMGKRTAALVLVCAGILLCGRSSARYRSMRAARMWTMMPCGLRDARPVGARSVFRPDVRKEKGGFGLLFFLQKNNKISPNPVKSVDISRET